MQIFELIDIVLFTSHTDNRESGEGCEGNEGSVEIRIVYHYIDLKYLQYLTHDYIITIY